MSPDRYTTMLLNQVESLKGLLARERKAKARQRDRAELWKHRALAKGKK